MLTETTHTHTTMDAEGAFEEYESKEGVGQVPYSSLECFKKQTVEYMYARGKGCARGAGDLEHDGGCLG